MIEAIVNLICKGCNTKRKLRLKGGQEVVFNECPHCHRPFEESSKSELAKKLADAVKKTIAEEPDKIFEGNLRTQVEIYY
jgi:hypothetical protein